MSNNSSTFVTADQATPTLADKISRGFERHWLAIFNTGWGIFVIMPFIAPLFMALGFNRVGKFLYFIYNFFCHQLPERSWFLFGSQFSYTKEQIALSYCANPEVSSAWFPFQFMAMVSDELMKCHFQVISSELVRRQFIGNADLGWKIAWSDRMIGMYTSIFVFGIIYAIFRNRGIYLKGISVFAFLALIAPLAIDGTTHLINDIFRLSFRDTNQWAVILTMNILPAGFYGGDMFGSLNSVLRIVSGILFGLGVVGFLWPLMDEEFSPHRRQMR